METYKKYNYIVYWHEQTGNFCAYVQIPKGHPYEKKVDKKTTINLDRIVAKSKKVNPLPKGMNLTFYTGYDNIPIKCHMGLTFSRRIKNKNNFPQGFSEGAWIGWDYGHYGDKTNFFNGKSWTKEEVEKECKSVIRQLKKQTNE